MRYEPYFQYTKGWKEVKITSDMPFSIMTWCVKYESPHGYHIVKEFGKQLELNVKSIRFESQEDAMLFALTWE